jgi:hypothetical protein
MDIPGVGTGSAFRAVKGWDHWGMAGITHIMEATPRPAPIAARVF